MRFGVSIVTTVRVCGSCSGMIECQLSRAHTWPCCFVGMAAVSIAPSPPHFENQFVEQVWEAFKPYALTLRDIIMHNIQPSQEPPDPSGSSPSTPLKLPSIQTRRAACTHLTMGRLNGKYECMICHKPSELGWVYSCTQDDEQCTLRKFCPLALLPEESH